MKYTKNFLAVVAALTILTGCANSADTATGETNTSNPTTSVTSSPDDPAVATTPELTSETSEDLPEVDNAGSDENVEPHGDADSFDFDDASVVEISLGSTISATSDAVLIEGSTATIVSAGVYEVTGILTDGELIVDTDDDAPVQIILSNANITNNDGAAIAVMNAETAIVILADGTSNMLTDGEDYVFAEGEDEPNATLFSKADLTLGGAGSLTVVGNYNDGIASKDGLVIASGIITVDAIDDGIRGKDYVVIEGGHIDVTAGDDGIKSDNDEDAERGYIVIADGLVEVASVDDGLQAETDVLISGGTVEISAGATGDSDSARGIVGDVLVAITGGTIKADAADDAVHSNSTVTIDGGDLTLASGDDAIHGDLFVTIDAGSVLITESFEGIESEVITINGGFIDVTSSDDGLNVAGADDATTADPALAEPAPVDPAVAGERPARGGGRGGGAGDEGVGEYYIYINGGTILITITDDLPEQGDGIDANGHIVMTGGVVAVSGPTDTRNSALDYSGGSFEMSGGMLIGTNVNGRNSEGIGIGSSQASLYVTLNSVANAGTLVHIRSADGESLVTFEPANRFDVIVFGSADLVAGETYEVYVGGTGSDESTAGLYETYSPGTLAGTATAA